MKKCLLLPLVALGLVAWVPSQAKAGVHVTFGFGAPAYYGLLPWLPLLLLLPPVPASLASLAPLLLSPSLLA
jgi:hypothetical protein